MPSTLTSEQQANLDKLSGLSGKEFDRQFMKTIKSGHEADLAAFQKQAIDGKDPDLRSFAAQTVPGLKMHSDMVKREMRRM
jgi:putative membrane protein